VENGVIGDLGLRLAVGLGFRGVGQLVSVRKQNDERQVFMSSKAHLIGSRAAEGQMLEMWVEHEHG